MILTSSAFDVTPPPQGDFPWDEKEFRYLAVTASGLGSVLLYLYFRDNGREISWKDFVHRYVSRGAVRNAAASHVRPLTNAALKRRVGLCRWIGWRSSTNST